MSLIGEWLSRKRLTRNVDMPEDLDEHDRAILALAHRYSMARTCPQPVGYVQSLEARLLRAARAWAMPGDPPESAESIEAEPWP